MAAVYQLVEFVLQGARDWAGFAVADGAEIDFAQGDDLGRCAADENLVGNIKLIAGDGLLDDGVTQVAGERDEAVASDAFENSGARGGGDSFVAIVTAVFTTNYK